MSKKSSPSTVCQVCDALVSVVFLVDDHGPVFTPVFHKDQAVSAVIGTKFLPYPEVDSYVEGEHKWLCEKCLRRSYAT